MKKYYITDRWDMIDDDIYEWLTASLTEDQYNIFNDGFLIDSYYVEFNDPAAETLYILRWS